MFYVVALIKRFLNLTARVIRIAVNRKLVRSQSLGLGSKNSDGIPATSLA